MKTFARSSKTILALCGAVLLLGGCAASTQTAQEPSPQVTASLPTPSPTPTPAPTPLQFEGVLVGEQTETLTLDAGSDLTFLAGLAPELPNLRLVDFGERIPTAEELSSLREAFPAAELHYSVQYAGTLLPWDTTVLDLTALRRDGVAEALDAAARLPMLESVDLGRESDGEDSLTIADVKEFQAACPQAQVAFTFNRFGKRISTLDEKLDFRGIAMDDNGAAVLDFLPCMQRCTSLDMDNCGVPDSVMASIREAYPQINVVWRVFFGRYLYGCRTDVVRLMCSDGRNKVTAADMEPIKYCTSLRYLDLGHNSIEDISFLRDLPDLEVVILVDNTFTDISPLADLEKLEYLEIFETNIVDLSPLAGLEDLRYLNICRCPEINDLSPLYGLKDLKRLYIGRDDKSVPPEQLETIREELPDTEINTYTWNPVLDGWRDDERYDLLCTQMRYINGCNFYWVP